MKIEVDSLWICNSDYKCCIQRNFKPNLICNGLHNWNITGKSVPLRYSTEPELDISIFAPISHNRNLSLAPPSSYIAKHLTSFEQISFASKIEWTSFTYGKHQVLLVWEYPLPISIVNAYEIRYDNTKKGRRMIWLIFTFKLPIRSSSNSSGTTPLLPSWFSTTRSIWMCDIMDVNKHNPNK